MRKKYKVIKNERISEGVYEIEYYVWTGCYCDKTKKQGVLHQERKPKLKDIHRHDRETSI